MIEKPIMAGINYKLLKYARKKRHLSLENAAVDILPVQELENAENFERKIGFEEFRKLADRYKYSINFFFLDKLPTMKMRWHWWIGDIQRRLVRWLIVHWNLQSDITDL